MSIQTTLTQDLPEGWYADPENPRLQRWWAGSEWTDHVRHSDGPARPRLTLAADPIAVSQPAFVPPTFAPAPSFGSISPTHSAPSSYLGAVALAAPLAEPEISTYVPMSHYYRPTGARLGTPNLRSHTPGTTWIWLLAVSPILWTAFQVLSQLSAPGSQNTSLSIPGAAIAVLFIAVALDGRELRRRSIQSPSMGWFLLGVAPYFIARWVVLRGQGIRHSAPGVTFAVSLTASVAVWAYSTGMLTVAS